LPYVDSIGVVREVLDNDTFILEAMQGVYLEQSPSAWKSLVDDNSSVQEGRTYFLSDKTEGAISAQEPKGLGSLSKPVYFCLSSTVMLVLNLRGLVAHYTLQGEGYIAEAGTFSEDPAYSPIPVNRHSEKPFEQPDPALMKYGQLAVNSADGAVYLKKTDDTLALLQTLPATVRADWLVPTPLVREDTQVHSGSLVRIDSRVSAVNLSLPSNPIDGDTVGFINVYGAVKHYPITLFSNNTINYAQYRMNLDDVSGMYLFIYNGADNSWVYSLFSSSRVTSISPEPPDSPMVGDVWFNESNGRTYTRYRTGSNEIWVEF
jgi:hypothetical protein